MPSAAPSVAVAASAQKPGQTPAPSLEPERFLARLRGSLADGSFSQLQLARPHHADPTLDKLLARRVLLRGQDHLSLVWRHHSKDITKNLPLPEALDLLATLVPAQFHHAHLVTRSHDVQLATDRKGQWRLRVGKLGPAQPAAPQAAGGVAPAASGPTGRSGPSGLAGPTGQQSAANSPAPPTAHDRVRQHPLTLDTPFLADLGVTDVQHRLVPAMARKWRQINKFVEVLGHALDRSTLAKAPRVRVLDFGAGKGYLTFAVHHHLAQRGQVPDVVGVELREDLTTLCNAAVARLGLAGLHFASGDVRHFVKPGGGHQTDIMIALHACDTATDVAMHRGITEGAAIILCSPCCHKQLRPQMVAPPLLQPMLRHGIHMAEQAEMLTDSLRALLLQSAGYDTQVFEFVSPEHTSKNKMVLAVRRERPLPAAQQATLRDQVRALKAHYGVQTQYLESLLDAEATGAAAPDEPGVCEPPRALDD